jgi:membrane-associated phospholipid phosphatase
VGVFDLMLLRTSEKPLHQGRLARGLRQAVLLAAVMFASLGLYLVVLKWRGSDAGLVTYTPVDEIIPFQPAWVWLYLIPYVVGPFAFALVTAETFWWYIRRGLVIVFVSLAIFAAVPTQTAARPPATHLESGLTALLYHHMIAIDDPPANAAPSLHVSLTFLLALALVRDFPRWWAVAFGGVVVVWLATLFTRQHHLLDVATGILLTAVVVLAWPPWRRDKVTEEIGDTACRRK